MKVIDLSEARARRKHKRPDIMLGARIRVSDDDSGRSFHEGTVVAVEPICTERGLGECLRVMVGRRVIDNTEQAFAAGHVLLVDDSIPVRRVVALELNRHRQASKDD